MMPIPIITIYSIPNSTRVPELILKVEAFVLNILGYRYNKIFLRSYFPSGGKKENNFLRDIG